MIILEVSIEDVALIAVLEAEGHSPIPADGHGKTSSFVAGKRVKPASALQIGDASRARRATYHM
jgi:hypothetical protein